MKVTASPNFNQYRNAVLGLDKKDFKDLQSGKIADIDKKIVNKTPAAFIETKDLKGVSNGKHTV